MIISFINQKGGVAKTTTSVHFAYWLHRQGKTVSLIDADSQSSSSQWLAGMKETIKHESIQNPDDLLEKTPAIARGNTVTIIDSPASLAESSRAILFRSDLAIIPIQPTGVDLRSASEAMRLIRQAQSVRGGKPSSVIFLSRAVKGTRLKSEAIALLSQIPDSLLLKSIIHQRQIIADTSGQSATVWDFLPLAAAKEAAQEYDSLFTEIMKLCENL